MYEDLNLSFNNSKMYFIRLIISNYHLLDKRTFLEEQTDSREKFFEPGGKLRELSFIDN